MQEICIVRECGAEARHYIRTSKKPGVTFNSCTYHASGVYVLVGKLYHGKVTMGTSFSVETNVVHRMIGSQPRRHELAG